MDTRREIEKEIVIDRIDAKILIVDDRRDIRFLAQHIVEKAGGRVATVSNGAEAIEALMGPDADESIDLVLMDMQMPVMDGFQAVAELRSRGYAKPIIALTANAMSEDRERCLSAGCDEYTTKPLDNRVLSRLICQCLKAKEQASDLVD
jgi:CheY-like chemotaxis protein